MKNKEIYSAIFGFYELEKATKGEKEKIRKLIMRRLKKEYGKREWEDLTAFEKKQFIYITLRRPMLENYIGPVHAKAINRKLDNAIRNDLLREYNEIKKYNERISNIYCNYYNDKATDEAKKEAYEQLEKDCRRINPNCTLPTFEQWSKHPLRPFDIVTADRFELSNSNAEEFAPQSEINYIILKTILKILEKKLNIKVDVSLINECLLFLDDFYVDEYEELLIDYDPELKLSKEEQAKIIQRNLTYARYRNMLDTLSFWEEE